MRDFYKKGAVAAMISFILSGCNNPADFYEDDFYEDEVEFNWMPNDLLWQHNVRDCRSKPHCDAADLFQRT